MNRTNLNGLGFLLLFWSSLNAQFSAANLLEYQLGNLPDTEPDHLSTLYDQLDLSYTVDRFIFDVKLEQFQTADRSRQYAQLAQRSVYFRMDQLHLTVGNFYHIIGRGLLLRSYEIPGTTIEDPALRTRTGFFRDIDGVLVKYDPGFAEVSVFQGRPLNNTLPPTIDREFRRPNLLEGADATIYLNAMTFGGAYLRNNVQEKIEEYFSLNFSLNLPYDIQVYSEYAQQKGNGNPLFDLSDNSTHAFYAGLNLLHGPFGMTAEYKDYNNFLLGYNDPPPLVKEHQYLLLNRLTHRLLPLNESGWQTEFFYTLGRRLIFTINISEAVNEAGLQQNVFLERFFEVYYKINPQTGVKGFFDFSSETWPIREERYSAGIYADTQLNSRWGVTADLEVQSVERTFLEKENYRNYAAIFSVSYAPDVSTGLILEKSDDTLELAAGENERYWVGGTLSYVYEQNVVTVFYGKRRGGNACTSGLCYEILPFEGLEVRLTTIL